MKLMNLALLPYESLSPEEMITIEGGGGNDCEKAADEILALAMAQYS